MTSIRQGFDLGDVKTYRLIPSARFVMALTVTLGMFTVNLVFFGFNFCITCMVNSTLDVDPMTDIDGPGSINVSNTSTDPNSCLNQISHESNGYRGTYRWSTLEQSLILSGMGWGAFLVIFASGILVDRIGIRIIYIAGLVVLGITMYLMPFVSSKGWVGMFILRIIQGALQVVGFPALVVISTLWFPVTERGLLLSIGASGTCLGGLVSFGISGYFCSSSAGWQGLFYLVASISIAVAIVFVVVFFDDCEKSWLCSPAESRYIKRTRGQEGPAEKLATPWRALLSSPPVWALMIVSFSQYYFYFFVANYMATYYKEVLGLEVEKSGVYAAIALLIQCIGRLTSGPLSDVVEYRFSATIAVKLMTGIAGYGSAVFLLGATFFDCHSIGGAIACFSLAYFFHGFVIGGFLKSNSYIAPPFTGTVAGLAQECDFLSGLLNPYITGGMLSTGAPSEWHHAMYLTCVTCAVGATFFVIFGSGEVQPWAKAQKAEDVYAMTATIEEQPKGKRRRMSLPRESLYSEIAFQ